MKNLILCVVCFCASVAAQPAHRATWCNPIDINYVYDIQNKASGASYRAGADPVIVPHKGMYYLFVTNSRGWWKSRDLSRWEFVTPSMWPADDICAPAALSVRDTLFLFPSCFDQQPLYYSTSPASGQLAVFTPKMPQMTGALGPWDPNIYHDEASDRWYLYFGSSDIYPIYWVELDYARHLAYKGDAKPLFRLHPELHGWERFGYDHRDTLHPFIEGSWMTKHNGTYYLQYAGPGTEYNAYSNGTYTGPSPTGPFTYAPYNPVAYKPGGFMAGAGHGNTFEDVYGNFWNTGTPWVAVNHKFERRVSLLPAGFDRDGDLYADSRFGDFPHYTPEGKWENSSELFTGWMLLSYRKPCMASSTLDTFAVRSVTDENPRTYWVAKTKNPGEWLTVDLKHECTVRAVQVNYTDYKMNVFGGDSTTYTQFRLSASNDRKTWRSIADMTKEKRDRPNAYVALPEGVKARYIRFEHVYVGGAHLAICDLRVFGNAPGRVPKAPQGFSVRRDSDTRNAFVAWKPVPGAVGYNILWGIAKDKLRQTYQVWNDEGNTREIRALTVGQPYYFAIEAFNETGVSARSVVLHCP